MATSRRKSVVRQVTDSEVTAQECTMCTRLNIAEPWMVQCDFCDGWIHFSCAGVDESIANEHFRCVKCILSPAKPPNPPKSKSSKSSSSSVRARRELELQRLAEEKAMQEKALQEKLEMEKQFLEKKYAILQAGIDDDDDDRSSTSYGSIKGDRSTVQQWVDKQELAMATGSGKDEIPTGPTSLTGIIPPRTSAPNQDDGQIASSSMVASCSTQVPAASTSSLAVVPLSPQTPVQSTQSFQFPFPTGTVPRVVMPSSFSTLPPLEFSPITFRQQNLIPDVSMVISPPETSATLDSTRSTYYQWSGIQQQQDSRGLLPIEWYPDISVAPTSTVTSNSSKTLQAGMFTPNVPPMVNQTRPSTMYDPAQRQGRIGSSTIVSTTPYGVISSSSVNYPPPRSRVVTNTNPTYFPPVQMRTSSQAIVDDVRRSVTTAINPICQSGPQVFSVSSYSNPITTPVVVDRTSRESQVSSVLQTLCVPTAVSSYDPGVQRLGATLASVRDSVQAQSFSVPTVGQQPSVFGIGVQPSVPASLAPGSGLQTSSNVPWIQRLGVSSASVRDSFQAQSSGVPIAGQQPPAFGIGVQPITSAAIAPGSGLQASSYAPGIQQLGAASAGVREPVQDPVPMYGPTPQQIAARHVVPRELPEFTGDPSEWPLFASSYYNSTAMCGYSDGENLMRLQRCLKGNAREAVRCHLLHPTSVPQIMMTLHTLYGRPELIVRCLLNKVHATPVPKADKLESLVSFGLVVQNLCSHLQSMGMEAHLSNPTLLEELVEKLPTNIKLDWALYQRQLGVVDMRAFGEYMATIVSAASRVTFGTEAGKRPEKQKTKEKGYLNAHSIEEAGKNEQSEERKGNSKGASTVPENPRPCLVCKKEGHKMKDCRSFLKANIENRWKLVQQTNVCRRCLIPHGKWPCKATVCGTNGCELRHHKLLHPGKPEEASSAKAQPVTTTTGTINLHRQQPRPTLFRVLPVTIYGKDSTVNTMAFLDDGSSFTLVEKELAKELGVSGEVEPLCLQWTSGVKRTEAKSELIELQIAGANSDRKHALSDVRTVEKLDLPPQSLRYPELAEKYEYLRGLPVASYDSAVPRILIGVDNASLLVTLKKREGKKYEPVAAKTRLGWTIFGTVEGFDGSPEHRHLHICARSSDQELHDTVKEFFSVESVGVAVAPEVEAEDDRRAREMLSETTIRTSTGRFQTGLLWKHDYVEFPDSRDMAEQRLKCLERRLAKNPELYANVNQQIVDYQRKGYAHKLTPEESINSDPRRVWYLPLGVVLNPNKPGKVRVIWDAAAKVEGTSFNSMLLKGPDLLTSLTVVLYRFRQRQVAIAGDIKEMFHQIQIRPQDQQAQRFLWREEPGKPAQVYVMDVATFGSTCSPCSAHYVKNRNAEEWKHQFPEATKWGKGPNFQEDSRWFCGPEFLYKDEAEWPKEDQPLLDTAEELRPVYAASQHHRAPPEAVIDYRRFSKLERLIRAIGYVRRFIAVIRKKFVAEIPGSVMLSRQEILEAEMTVWRWVQADAYPDELVILRRNEELQLHERRKLEKSSPLRKLSPFVDEAGVLRAEGRLSNAPCAEYDAKFPVILPRCHYFTELLIGWYHRRYAHGNGETVLNEMRQRFHISSLRTVIRRVVKRCTWCAVYRCTPRAPRMAPLPEARITPYVRAFTFIGIDYCGPFPIRAGRSQVKVWVMLITCLTVRAVHLESVGSLSTEACKLAIRRFVAWRGAPQEIYSDQGTNFVGASRELRGEIASINRAMAGTFTNRDTQWYLNPPAAPHMGGVWERLVRSVKTALRTVSTVKNPNDETFRTFLAEAASIVNSRPLTYVPLETEDGEALTPNHFLMLSSSGVVQSSRPTGTGQALRTNWDTVQDLLDQFWLRWIKEYLPSISCRSKWFTDSKPIQPGDLVVLVDKEFRTGWVRGRVVKVYNGKDGRIRRADVRTANGVLQRPVTGLAVLEVLEAGTAGRDVQQYGSGIVEETTYPGHPSNHSSAE